MQHANKIIYQLKIILNLSTDLELANFLNISPTTLSTWKSRNSIDYKMIINLCDEHNIDLNKLFLDKEILIKSQNNPFDMLIKAITEEVEKRLSTQLDELKATNELIYDLLDKEDVKRKIEEAKGKMAAKNNGVTKNQ
jgi:transcriptional regulator with XRE-family HTH domain